MPTTEIVPSPVGLLRGSKTNLPFVVLKFQNKDTLPEINVGPELSNRIGRCRSSLWDGLEG